MAWASMDDLATGDLVTESDMDAIRGNIEYLLDPNAQRILRASSDYTTSSTSFVDVDGTNLAATITTNGGPVLVIVSCGVTNSNSGVYVDLDIDVDGGRLGNTAGLLRLRQVTGGVGNYQNGSFSVLVTGLSAGSHTFKLQWKVNVGTARMMSSTTENPVQLSVIEI